MAQDFECPNCGAPIDYYNPDKPTVRCQYCGKTVIVPVELRAQTPQTFAIDLTPNISETTISPSARRWFGWIIAAAAIYALTLGPKPPVALGAFLSGGLDSTLIASYAARGVGVVATWLDGGSAGRARQSAMAGDPEVVSGVAGVIAIQANLAVGGKRCVRQCWGLGAQELVAHAQAVEHEGGGADGGAGGGPSRVDAARRKVQLRGRVHAADARLEAERERARALSRRQPRGRDPHRRACRQHGPRRRERGPLGEPCEGGQGRADSPGDRREADRDLRHGRQQPSRAQRRCSRSRQKSQG